MSVDKANGVHCYLIYGLYEGVNVAALQRYLLDSVEILSYWNHLPLIYCVKSKLAVNDLTQRLMPFFSGRLFMVVKVEPDSVNGWLPQPAWEWFRTPAPPTKVSSSLPNPFTHLIPPNKQGG